MPIFEPGQHLGTWLPSTLAAGPFAGLQGGAIAGLLTGEIEAQSSGRGWGSAVSASVWFLRAVPMAALRTQIAPIRVGGRINVIDNALFVEGQEEPSAVARVTLTTAKPIAIEGFVAPLEDQTNPLELAMTSRPAPHGGPWFMDAMETRVSPSVSWFKLKHDVVAGAGPLARVLGPADWAHGINRPVQNVVADPNHNLNVHLFAAPRGDWIGVEAQTHWQPETGDGMGGGLLRDVYGVIGRVSMSVALINFPKPR